MRAESSLLPKSRGSFGETGAVARDAGRAGRVRMRVAVAVMVVGAVVAFAPGLAAGDRFVSVMPIWFNPSRWDDRKDGLVWTEISGRFDFSWPHRFEPLRGTSAVDLARLDSSWTIVAATLALVPALFVWWRRANFAFARAAGVACAVVASAAVVVLVKSMPGLSKLPGGAWWTVPVGGALMAAAFVVAPAPRVRDE